MPLAYSARCFTARALNRAKDECKLACLEYPQGLTAKSQEQEDVFVLNGIQTQSGHCYNLINQLESMDGLVDVIRLSPETDTLEWLAKFDKQQATPQRYTLPNRECNGYWMNMAGMQLV